jgi:hypothetical protein
MPVVPATQEAEAELFEPWRSAWTTISKKVKMNLKQKKRAIAFC